MYKKREKKQLKQNMNMLYQCIMRRMGNPQTRKRNREVKGNKIRRKRWSCDQKVMVLFQFMNKNLDFILWKCVTNKACF